MAKNRILNENSASTSGVVPGEPLFASMDSADPDPIRSGGGWHSKAAHRRRRATKAKRGGGVHFRKCEVSVERRVTFGWPALRRKHSLTGCAGCCRVGGIPQPRANELIIAVKTAERMHSEGRTSRGWRRTPRMSRSKRHRQSCSII